MRFLQIEWHNHERLRNAWDIEREEMKQKIARQEGVNKKLKRMTEVLDKHVKMLESALRTERAKTKVTTAGEKHPEEDETARDAKGKNALKNEITSGTMASKRALHVSPPPKWFEEKSLTRSAAPNKPHNSLLDLEGAATEAEKDMQLDKSRKYLTKCVEEITYLLLPPNHPPPPQSSVQSLANSAYLHQSDAPMTMEDVFLQQRQKGQQQSNAGLSQPLPNHQPAPTQPPDLSHLSQAAHQSHPQAEFMTREPSGQAHFGHVQSLAASPFPGTENNAPGFPTPTEEPLERVTHSYDAFGRPITAREDESLSLASGRQTVTDLSDGFTFEDATGAMEPAPDTLPSRRPDTDLFPSANSIPVRSPPRMTAVSHRRRSSGSVGMARRRSQEHETQGAAAGQNARSDPQQFKVRFALRGHLDVVRSVIFTGGGSPSEPEICTAGDDGMIKRWIIPASYSAFSGPHGPANDLDIPSYFTHRGHDGVVTSLAACPATSSFSTGGRVSGDGWIFSGGQDATVRVWERGRVDPKATLEGHTDAVWSVCVLPATSASVFGQNCNNFGGPDRVLLASGAADGTVKIWAVSAPPQLASPQTGSRRGVGGSRRHSVTSGSNYPSSPQPSIATSTPFHYNLVHSIERPGLPSPTCICPLSMSGETFVVSYNDASILIFDTRTGEEIIGMASTETYDGTPKTGVNAVVATSVGLEGTMSLESGRGMAEDDSPVHGATGSTADGGVEGVLISGHEDQFIRFFDANSGAYRQAHLDDESESADISQQANAHTACLHILPPYLRFHSAKTAERRFPPVTMQAFASGAWRSVSAHK